jgi:AMP phosphorylase
VSETLETAKGADPPQVLVAEEPRLMTVTVIDVAPGHPEVYLNVEDAEDDGLHPLDRVALVDPHTRARAAAVVKTTKTLVKPGEVGVTKEVVERMHAKPGDRVHLLHAPRPPSIEIIRRKMDGQPFTPEEVRVVINDIAQGNLSDIELTAYAVAVYVHDLNHKEIVAMIEAMVDGGESITFDKGPVLDIHSIGGVPGNKYAPLVVSIVAANGCIIPKTSSRAISSACGTADFMEVLCPVEHGAKDIKRIAETVGGTLSWGGGVRLAPADDAIIRVEYPLSMDPHGQLIASVLAKKKAVGAQLVVIEIPTGTGAKVDTDDKARRLARDFIAVGEKIGIKIRVAITFGAQPIGYAIGPALEAREALAALEGTKRPGSLIEKACELAGLLLELAGKAPKGEGYKLARDTLESGAAHKKFMELIEMQGGKKDQQSKDIKVGPLYETILSPQMGYVESIDNKALVKIARAAGAPRDKGAGVLLKHKLGNRVEKGDVLYTIYAEHNHKLEEAKRVASLLRPLKIEGMIMEEVVE